MHLPASNENKRFWSNRGVDILLCWWIVIFYCCDWTSYIIISIFATQQVAFGSRGEDLSKGIGNAPAENSNIFVVVINYVNIFYHTRTTFRNLSKSLFECATNPSSSQHASKVKCDSRVDIHNASMHSSSSEFDNHPKENPPPGLIPPNDYSPSSLKNESNQLSSSSSSLTSLSSKIFIDNLHKRKKKECNYFSTKESTLLACHFSKSSINSSSCHSFILRSPEPLKKISGPSNTFDFSSFKIISKKTLKIILSYEPLTTLKTKKKFYFLSPGYHSNHFKDGSSLSDFTKEKLGSKEP